MTKAEDIEKEIIRKYGLKNVNNTQKRMDEKLTSDQQLKLEIEMLDYNEAYRKYVERRRLRGYRE